MKRSFWLHLFALPGLMICVTGCSTSSRLKNHVFTYERQEVIAYLRPFGFETDHIYASWQNSSGTRLYFQEDPRGRSNVVWVIDQRNETPVRIECSLGDCWIRDDNQVISLPPFVAKSGGIKIDRQSGCFVQHGEVLKIGNFNSPEGWLFEIPNDPQEEFSPSQIFACGDRLVLLQVRDGNSELLFEYHQNCWIIDMGKGIPTISRKFERRLSAWGICVSPFTAQLLCRSYCFMPWPSRLLLYDVERGNQTDLGFEDSFIHFILPTDFLRSRLGEQKRGPQSLNTLIYEVTDNGSGVCPSKRLNPSAFRKGETGRVQYSNVLLHFHAIEAKSSVLDQSRYLIPVI